MTRDDVYQHMQETVEALLPELEEFARKAKNVPARKRLTERLEHLRDALDRAKQISPRR